MRPRLPIRRPAGAWRRSIRPSRLPAAYPNTRRRAKIATHTMETHIAARNDAAPQRSCVRRQLLHNGKPPLHGPQPSCHLLVAPGTLVIRDFVRKVGQHRLPLAALAIIPTGSSAPRNGKLSVSSPSVPGHDVVLQPHFRVIVEDGSAIG